MNKIEQRAERIMVQLGLTSPSIKQIFREHLGEIAREAYDQGITDCDCDTSLGRFEQWLNEQK